jgi:hypothetical protein
MKFILWLDRKLPPNLFRPRRIASTAEIDRRFFPNRRIPLLLPAAARLPSSLMSAGAERDERSTFVRQGAAVNLAVLDPLLPFAARQTITPVLADLIPATSWAQISTTFFHNPRGMNCAAAPFAKPAFAAKPAAPAGTSNATSFGSITNR